MALPVSYNLRSLRSRWPVTLFSVVGIALASLVFVALSAMASGFRTALRATGRTDNAIVLERGMASELMSDVSIEEAEIVAVAPQIARRADGAPLLSREIQSLISLRRAGEAEDVNVAVRGVTPLTFEVRTGVRIVAGRLFEAAAQEVIVGRRLSQRYGLGVGSQVPVRRTAWQVVGVFASEGSGFESEIWGDRETLAGPLRRTRSYQSLVFRMADPRALPETRRALEGNRRLSVRVWQERQFYDEQAGTVVQALIGIALLVALVMGLGAVLAAMNTMYGVVATRVREIGTLRALGFSRSAILVCFVLESAVLGIVGGLVGCVLALPANGLTSATYGANYAEMAFAFRTSPAVLGIGLLFAAVVGGTGGLLPAIRAARLPISSALREA
jgi:putative ABC transport system permease protein